MITRLGISSDRLGVMANQPALNLWALSPEQVRPTLEALAEDMSAAAVEAGDHALAGAGRAFAAQRAITAEQLRESVSRGVDPFYRNKQTETESEVEVMEEEEW
ncbi:hypothetical protein AB0M12_41765 [Nocardia vinacea]|uniref:hypothetical protein n=1 Tax=Nocardia vinacea TaxID=96468 RepID=UPI00344A72D4